MRARGIKPLMLRGEQRQAYGSIFTLRNLDTDEWMCIHRTGSLAERVQAVADWIDASGEPWRVTSISSPESIYRDLQGTRAMREPGVNQTSGKERNLDAEFDPLATERQSFGRIRRSELVYGKSPGQWRRERAALPKISRRVLA